MESYVTCFAGMSFNDIEIPIVGYEVMEERAKFTVNYWNDSFLYINRKIL